MNLELEDTALPIFNDGAPDEIFEYGEGLSLPTEEEQLAWQASWELAAQETRPRPNPRNVVNLNPRTLTIIGRGPVTHTQQLHRRWFHWSRLEPTGYFIRANEQVTIRVNGNHNIGAYITTFRMPWGHEPTLRVLTPGSNIISNASAGLLYFSVEHPVGVTVNVEIVTGGTPSCLFRQGVHTVSDWQYMLNNYTESGMVELVNDRVLVTVYRASAWGSAIRNGNPANALDFHRRSVEYQDEFCGLADFMPHERDRPDRHRKAFVELIPGGFLAVAGSNATGYRLNSVTELLVPLFNGQWGPGFVPWHEQGHTRQILPWLWDHNNMAEVTVELYSNYTGIRFGLSSIFERTGHWAFNNIFGNHVFPYLNRPTRNYDTLLVESGHEPRLVAAAMYWQLALAFGENFYPRLHQMYRAAAPNEIPTNSFAGNLARQTFIRMASQCANRNLAPFFDRWGVQVNQVTRDFLSSLPQLQQEIWRGRDSNPVIEYVMPGIFPPVLQISIINNEVNLSWDTPVSVWGIQRYEIWRNGQLLNTTTGMSFRDSGANLQNSNSYVVRAVNQRNQVSTNSNQVARNSDGSLILGPPIPDGTVSYHNNRIRIITALNGSSVMLPSNTSLVLGQRQNNNNQIWELTQATNGSSYFIRNLADGRFLTAQGNTVTMTQNSTALSLWNLVPGAAGSVQIQNNSNSRVLDVQGGGTTANGTSIITWGSSAGTNQRWFLDVVYSPAPPLPSIDGGHFELITVMNGTSPVASINGTVALSTA
ncbi:MAG: M60 family metallopeptidase, partial [Turicibacter sp.]|nr:M60 family metallopeptidase [Turicibacter sp.]